MHVEMRLMSSVYNDNNKSFDLVGNNNESVFFEHMDQIDRMYHMFSTSLLFIYQIMNGVWCGSAQTPSHQFQYSP